jgi:hypothetical protein
VRQGGNWLLVEVLDQHSPGVIAVGALPKKRVPLASFVRESDRGDVLAAVAQCCRRGTPVGGASSRAIAVDPIVDDQSGQVFGVWARVGGAETHAGHERPAAWPFVWDLETGIARRGPIVGGGESWSGLGIDRTRSIASGMAHLDLGDSVASVLSKLVESSDGTTLQEKAVEHRPDGSARRIQVFARFCRRRSTRESSQDQVGRLVRGVTVDIGPYEESAGTAAPHSLGDLIARSSAEAGEYRAVMDPSSLELLYWYGPSPDCLQWNHISSSIPRKRPVLHSSDLDQVQRAVATLSRESGPTTVKVALTLRFRTTEDTFIHVPATLGNLDLGAGSRAVLVTLKLPPEAGGSER